MLILTAQKIDELAKKIIKMPKYKNVEIPYDTVRSMINQSLSSSKNVNDLEKRVREKIHNIVALYLGDIDYKKAMDEFNHIKKDQIAIREFSQRLLMCHASTKERGKDLTTLYETLFMKLGEFKNIADFACALHPLGLPFMNLSIDTAYFAYDLNKPRVDFINMFITEQGFKGGCFHQDILINPPQLNFDVALFLKEAHRLENRQSGSLVKFLNNINAAKIVVSLPIYNMGSKHKLSAKYEKIILNYSNEKKCDVDTLLIKNELFYILSKADIN